MNADTVPIGASRGRQWRALFGWLGTMGGLLGAGAAASTTPAVAQRGDYRAAASVPAAWQAFAGQLQGRFQQRLAADDDAAQRFRAQLEQRAESGGAAPVAVTLRAWILPDGRIERVEFEALDQGTALTLRTLLMHGDVGAPPPDMLQPLHLRLTLRSNDQPVQGK